MLNAVHHAPQHPLEVLSSRTTKSKSLHKVITAAIDHHQVRNTILRDLEAMEIYIRRSITPELCRATVINLGLVKMGEKGYSFTYRIRNGGRTTANLKLRRSDREWTYQESTKYEMRGRDLKRTNSPKKKNEEGDKGKEIGRAHV